MGKTRPLSIWIEHRYARHAVVTAGLASFAAGLLLYVWFPRAFSAYSVLFGSALILGVVALFQRRPGWGLALLLMTVTVPPVLVKTGIGGLEQVPDLSFYPPLEKPAWPSGRGPVVLIDQAHANFHTASGRYRPFANLLQRDGFIVKASAAQFSAKVLEAGRILVIANAAATIPPGEAAAVRNWVAGGGAMLLIADHPPFDTAAKELGKAFGIRFSGGVAGTGPLIFRRSNGTLQDHAITKGIDAVATFTGTSFQLDASGQPLLVFGPEVYLRRNLRERDDSNPVPLKDHLQGAVLVFGKGRAAVFGEAAMFSAQLADLDRHPMGMNAEIASRNPQFLLNVLHWLSGIPG